MDTHILSHFRKNDPVLVPLIESIELEVIQPRHPDDYFMSLCSEIIGQQLSGKVADVIEARFRKLFPNDQISPNAVFKLSDRTLRSTGMSNAKVRYVKDLAKKVLDKEIQLSRLPELTDGDVITELVKIKGIGPWTAEMFLIFTLGRPDIFSFGDLGLRRAIQKLYRLRREPTLKHMQRLTKRWSPYRTYAARLLWRYKDAK